MSFFTTANEEKKNALKRRAREMELENRHCRNHGRSETAGGGPEGWKGNIGERDVVGAA